MGAGPLDGLKVVELAGLGPAPFAAMVLAGLGADIIRVDRPVKVDRFSDPRNDLLNRGRPCIAVDLKNPEGVDAVRRLCDAADVLIEGFRPGVAERLGLGPDELLARNPRLVYGRMTGWGQDGPLAPEVGHDINYIAITGALHAVGRKDSGPVPPLNLVGDFGGGAMLLVCGVLAALHERQTSGRGQVVDAAMVDGVTMLMAMIYGFRNQSIWTDERQDNMLDGGAPFYDTYECADGGWIAVGAIETQFFAAFEERLGIGPLGNQLDRAQWPEQKARIAARFKEKTRDEWAAVFAGSDACVAPVLSMPEAPQHPHVIARGALTEEDGILTPGVAPKFSRTPGALTRPSSVSGQDTREGLSHWGFSDDEIAGLEASGAVVQV
ncbi:MAG TPA: CaiB/BaiF CoA-transferase family protein [Mycobacteriales bacterium]|nr:CaiB/BaiF CoA-transferase family protein [Mycobacteriales bacterium]